MRLTDISTSAQCIAVRSAVLLRSNLTDALPPRLATHASVCVSCAREQDLVRDMASAFAAGRSEAYGAPLGLMNVVADGLGVRLASDAVSPPGLVEGETWLSRRGAALFTAVLAAAATGIVVTLRKRSQFAA
jgi:hypothetical protein